MFTKLSLAPTMWTTVVDEEEPEERPIVYIGGKRRALTKAVPPQWYKRYCHVLPDEEKIFTQPRRDLLTDGKLLREMEQMKLDEVEVVDQAKVLAQSLEEKIIDKEAAIIDIANGNFKRATNRFQTLKKLEKMPLVILDTKQQRDPRTVAGLKLRVGVTLKDKSKWKILTQNRSVVITLKHMKTDRRRKLLVYKFRKAIRIIRTVLRFGTIIADISRETSSVFKDFKKSKVMMTDGGLYFDKSRYESSFQHRKKIDEASVHTLRNLEFLRTDEAISKVATVLSKKCRSFRDFPANLQLALARSGWYADMPKDRVIIREGQEPNNFYFMLSGKTIAVKLKGSPIHKETSRFEIVCEYGPNDMFGHEDIYDCKHRNYSVLCAENSVFISVSYVDYMRVTALPPSGQQNPDHLKFLSRLSFMRHFPMLKLIRDSGNGNVFCFYFNPGVVISKEIRRSDYIFVIKSGKSTIIADVTDLNPNKRITDLNPYKRTDLNPNKRTDLNPYKRTDLNPNKRTDLNPNKRTDLNPYVTDLNPYKRTDLNPYKRTDLNPDKRIRAEKPLRKASTTSEITILRQSEKNRTNDFSAYPVLPDIMADQNENTNQSASSEVGSYKQSINQYKQSINKSFQEENMSHAAKPPKAPKQRKGPFTLSKNPNPILQVVLKQLVEGEVIGIEHVDLGDDVKQCDVKVVSDGCEVVMVNKDFFLSNASQNMQAYLRSMSFVFPTQQAIREKLRNQRYWQHWKDECIAQTQKNSDKTAS